VHVTLSLGNKTDDPEVQEAPPFAMQYYLVDWIRIECLEQMPQLLGIQKDRAIPTKNSAIFVPDMPLPTLETQ
jgi:hypothetical protein